MESHDEPGARRAGERSTDEVDVERGNPGGHGHRAGPDSPDAGFAKGIGDTPDAPDQEQEPDFARGERTMPDRDPAVQGKFSRGQEQLPEDLPDKTVERRFSEGIEQLPHDDR
jgi:hypothetical protein